MWKNKTFYIILKAFNLKEEFKKLLVILNIMLIKKLFWYDKENIKVIILFYFSSRTSDASR